MRNLLIYLCISVLVLVSLPAFAASNILHVQINGIQGDELKNVESQLAITQEDYANTLSAENIQEFYQHAPDTIRRALEPFGYFKTKISSSLTHTDKVWVARFNIALGPPIRIKQIDLQITGSGATNPELQKLLQHFPITNGHIFQSNNYEKAKLALFQTANNQGYIKAVLDKKLVEINLLSYSVKLTLHLNTGPRYYFGPIKFIQHHKKSKFSEDFLKRFLPFQPNEPFSSQKIILFQQKLSDSHYFDQANVSPTTDNLAGTAVPVDVDLMPNKAKQYNVGAGFGTYTGPRLTLGMGLRHLTDTGQHFSTQIKFSRALRGLAAQYVIPGSNPLTDQYTLGASAQKSILKAGEDFPMTLSASSSKSYENWKRAITLSYLKERFRLDSQDSSHNTRALIPRLTLSRIKADNVVNPKFGSRISLTLQGSSDLLLSNTKFMQTEVEGKYIFSPTDSCRVLLGGDFGYTIAKNALRLPISLQYFAGGLDSIRGFAYNSIGPGRFLKVGSAEIQHRIKGNWNGALFYDIGTASNHIRNPLNRSTGAGIVYDSIIGPLKLYVARRLSTPPHQGYGIEFSIGTEL